MALGDAYATAAEYRAVTQKSDTTQDADILVDLLAVSRYLEHRLERFFGVDTGDVSRIYVAPQGGPELRVDDMSTTPTTIIIDLNNDGSFESSDAFSSGDFELLPRNAPKEPEAQPYRVIRLTPWGTRGSFAEGQRVQVTGKFGWPAVPNGVQRATIHLTALLRLETPRATNQIAPMGDVGTLIATSRPAQDIVQRLVEGYGRIRYG